MEGELHTLQDIKEIVENDASNLSGESLLGPLIGAVMLISIALWPIPTLIIIGICLIFYDLIYTINKYTLLNF